MTIRLYQGKDIVALAPLVKDFVEHALTRHGQPEPVSLRDAAAVVRAWTKPAHRHLYVLDTGSALAGFALLRQEGQSVFVEELWADRGLDPGASAAELLAGLEAQADAQGASALHFEFRFGAPVGLGFLVAHGFDYLAGLDLVKPFGPVVEETVPVELFGQTFRRPSST